MKTKLIKAAAAALLAAAAVSASPYAASSTEKILPYNGETGTVYPGVTSSVTTHTYDFSETDIKFYSSDTAISTASLRTNMIFDGNTLSCKPGKTFSFGSAGFLGDDYGIYGGKASFRFEISGGELSAGVRLSKKSADNDHRGIWFSFDNEKIAVSEPESGFLVTVSKAVKSGTAVIDDKADVIELYIDGELVCGVLYDAYNGAVSVSDPQGKTLAEKGSTSVRPAGYFTVFADGLDGYVDDISFEHSSLTVSSAAAAQPVDYSNWVAADDRGRTTPTGIDKRDGKQVGIFYFLAHTGEDTEFIQDITKIYTENGLEGLTDHLTDPKSDGGYYWAEPYFGYYTSVDKWVYRKHAAQLSAAGVDFVFLDFTNGAYYPDALQVLLDTWLRIRQEGGTTPDICVCCHTAYGAVMDALRGTVYSEEGFAKYGELFYRYKGKPLLLAAVGDDDSETGKWCRETFTVRDCWAWTDEDGSWNWLQEYRKSGDKYRMMNGGPGRDADGNFEELALCVGHHPTMSKGRSFANGKIPKTEDDYGFSLDSGAGKGFEAQFNAVMYFDPEIVLITGWNEWGAGLSHYNDEDTFAGSPARGFQFVDQFNTEYSRDAEPMRMRQGDGVGFGDNFYYQMTGYIRTFKGTGPVAAASGQNGADLSDKSSWNNVGPVYTDTAGDTEWRSEDGYFTGCNYVNNSGRNDIVSAKVSQDAEYLYFRVDAANEIEMDGGKNRMNLFIDTDNDPKTGWEGFDLILNRARDGHYVSVESLENGWNGEQKGKALYTLDGETMVIRLSKEVAGMTGKVSEMRFKWADNSTLSGDVMEFDELGDAAPDGRFAFLYVCGEAADSKPAAEYTLLGQDGGVVPASDEKTPFSVTPSNGPEQRENGETNRSAVKKHSAALKIMIVAAGAVAGACLFSVIALPDIIKKKIK